MTVREQHFLAAVVQRLVENGYQGHIHITCYETDNIVLPLLEKNMLLLWNRQMFHI